MRDLHLRAVLMNLAGLLYSVNSQACNNNDTVGFTGTNKRSDISEAGKNGIFLYANKYKIDCCGFIDQWELYSLIGITPGVIIKGQVWEQAGTLWTLVGENDLQINTPNDKNTIPVTGSRIYVKPDNYLGFYEPTEPVVAGGNGGVHKKANLTDAETTYDWDSVADISSEYSINVRVQPSSPSFTNLDNFVIIDSSVTGGTILLTLTVTDGDAANSGQLLITYTGNTGSAAAMFEYDVINQQVKIQNDATIIPGDHDMTFSVSDGCSTDTGTLTIRVSNEPPVLTSLTTNNETTISESLSTETLLHELIVTDVQTVTCTLDSTGVPFLIKTIPGSLNNGIYLEEGAAMDYYAINSYVLDLSCDDGYESTSGAFTVYLILDEPPVITGLPIGIDTTEQSELETTLYTFSVTDPENAAVTCSYSTVPTTSLIFLKSSTNFNEFDIILQSYPNLNYDVTREYRVDINCNDNRRNDSSVFFMNVLRNQAPVFTNLQNTTSVSAPSSYIGQLIFDVEATDPEGDQLQYTMTCNQAPNCPFQIFHSGEILLTRSVKGESMPAYDVYVYVNDERTTTGPRTLTIHITDINYVPIITNLPLPSSLVVPENSALESSVFQVLIQDNDRSDVHTYSMTSVPSDGMLYFQIDPSTGLVNTSTTGINYESGSSISFNLSITVTDTKDSDTQDLLLTISDVKEPVLFTKHNYVLSLDEGLAGTVLTDPGYLYTDQDIGDTHTFGMDCETGGGYFTIAPATGFISLATDIDVDASGSLSSYACIVTISDGTFKDTATLNININNINDNTPVFSSKLYTVYLDIGTAVNQVFESTIATDGDSDGFGTFTYSINQSHLGTETFGIETDGDLYLKNPLTSFGYGQSLKFEVVATDTGGLQGSATVFILIPQMTSTVIQSNNDRYVTFWEYPANAAWVIACVVIGTIALILPCYMIQKYGGSCSCKGRVGENLPNNKEGKRNFTVDDNQLSAQDDFDWKPWKWFERRLH